jgi:hypothetical protein
MPGARLGIVDLFHDHRDALAGGPGYGLGERIYLLTVILDCQRGDILKFL